MPEDRKVLEDERPTYQSLYFGRSDSRNEATEDREGFLRSYVDLNDASKAVLKGDKFLVLGPKGTGKSALAWYLVPLTAGGSKARQATTK